MLAESQARGRAELEPRTPNHILRPLPLISARAGTCQVQEKGKKKKKNAKSTQWQSGIPTPLLCLGQLEAASLSLNQGRAWAGPYCRAAFPRDEGQPPGFLADCRPALPRLANCDLPSVVDFLISRLVGVRPEGANGKYMGHGCLLAVFGNGEKKNKTCRLFLS